MAESVLQQREEKRRGKKREEKVSSKFRDLSSSSSSTERETSDKDSLVSGQQLVELLALSNLELSSGSVLVVHSKDHIHVLHRLGLDVGEGLDLVGRVLDLVVRHLELELLDSGLDGVPSGETVTTGEQGEGEEGIGVSRGREGDGGRGEERKERRRDAPNRDVSSHTEILRVENLVGGRVVEDRLGVDTSLVGEGTPSGDVVVAERTRATRDRELRSARRFAEKSGNFPH